MMRWLRSALLVVLLGLGAWLLDHQLAPYRYGDLALELSRIGTGRIVAALLLTIVSFAAMTGYDLLALRQLGQRLPYRRVALASITGYAIGNSLGFPLLTGAPIRYRLYSRWGVPGPVILQAITFYSIALWLGVLVTGGLAFTVHPVRATPWPALGPVNLRPLGIGLLGLVAAYLIVAMRRAPRLRLGTFDLPLPGPRVATLQVLLAAVDWCLALAVMYVLLPAGAVGIGRFATAFILAQGIGLLSHVPGGLGVFESVLLLLLRDAIPAPVLVGVLVAYRGIYYLLPLLVALVTIGGYELALQRRGVAADTPIVRWLRSLMPSLLAGAVFLAGIVLLVSGATPSVHGRLAWLDRVLPLSVIELSHFLASAVGVALLLLARGLQRRLDVALNLTVALLAAGVALSLLKGVDYEEGILLLTVLFAVWASRARFNRRSALLDERFAPGWIAAVAIVLIATVWLGLFSYRHVEYSAELWWRFGPHADAPRFLRSTVAMAVVIGAVAVGRLLRPARAVPALPAPADLERAAPLVARASRTVGNLAYLGDKTLLFDDQGEGFLMYGVAGRAWVAMGDPVGSPTAMRRLGWRFRELADGFAAWPAFYQVRPEYLPIYLEMGFGLVKLGEEAVVDLDRFTLDVPARRSLRKSVRHAERQGCTFEVVPRGEVGRVMPALRGVSEEWCASKAASEKGFSLGRFDPAYLARFDTAIVRHAGEVVAFANIWEAAPGTEVAMDLMRHAERAPNGVMDYLLAELMAWAKAEGHARFSLGMAPFSGVEARPFAPFWSRVGRTVFHHGERFYPFQGLRRYKEKFDPTWEPRYLATQGRMVIPWVLAAVNRLVSAPPPRPDSPEHR